MNKITAVLSALSLLLAGCSKKEEKEAEPIIPVQVAPVRQDSIRRIITADAVLYPQDQASVTPKISAPVRKVYVNRGDHVRQGQLLATLESRDLAAATAESRGQYEQAESNYRSTASAAVPEEVTKAQNEAQAARQTLDAAQKLVESRRKLFSEGALARRLVDEAQVAYAQARSQYETAQEHLRALESVGKQEQIKGAQAQVQAAKGHFDATRAQLDYAEVRSPINGVVTDRPVYAGEMASAGTPLLTLMDVSRVVARASLPQAQAAYVKLGDPAVISQTDGTEQMPGKVIVVSPAVDPNTTTVQVWVQAPNPGERLRPGSAVRVSIVAATLNNATVAPPAAILPAKEGGATVLVVGADSVAHERKVELGVREADKVQILSGVSPGQQVIVVGGLGLEEGAKVRVLKPGETAGGEEKEEKKEEEKDHKPEGKGKK